MSVEHIDTKDTAALVRKSLTEAFPGVKFRVNISRYSGGSTIYVRWVDGPNQAQVKAVTNRFEGNYFDGMIDYKGSKYANLDGRVVKFSGWINLGRDYSDAMLQRAMAAVSKDYNKAPPADWLDQYKRGDLRRPTPMGNTPEWDVHWSWQAILDRALSKRSTLLAQDSPTAMRVSFAGDDGYGAGTVGMDGKGGNHGYSVVEQQTWKDAKDKRKDQEAIGLMVALGEHDKAREMAALLGVEVPGSGLLH